MDSHRSLDSLIEFLAWYKANHNIHGLKDEKILLEAIDKRSIQTA